MKQNNLFNNYLLKYNKYLSKLNRLQITGRNIRRQAILQKHISRLEKKLNSLLLSFKNVKVATALSAAALLAMPNAQAQNFDTVQTNPFGLTNIGGASRPTFVDIDGDGDLDLISGDIFGDFYYFQNTGSKTAPNFAERQQNPFNLKRISGTSIPTFVDIDGDGDFDIISGSGTGNFYFFENTGTVKDPAFGTAQKNPFGLTDIGNASSPTFIDIDDDGDLDMFSGSYGYYKPGNFFYFENEGSAKEPSFKAAETNPFSLTGLNTRYYNNSSTSFADLDNDGDLDLLSGQSSGQLYYFKNTSTPEAPDPSFTTPEENPFNLTDVDDYTYPTFVDIDDDGDFDIFSGASDGNFHFFKNIPESLSNNTIKANNTELVLAPNPATTTVSINTTENINNIGIYNIAGALVLQEKETTTLNIANLVSGVYLVKVETSNGTSIKKLIIE